MLEYFRGTPEKPYHLSVGAVVVNAAGEIACHQLIDGSYALMTETIEAGESIEGAVARGLQEEWGVVANFHTYIGSVITEFTRKESASLIQKTSLYCLLWLVDVRPELRSPEPDELDRKLTWLPPQRLLELGDTPHPDNAAASLFDQAEVIRRVLDMDTPFHTGQQR